MIKKKKRLKMSDVVHKRVMMVIAVVAEKDGREHEHIAAHSNIEQFSHSSESKMKSSRIERSQINQL